MTLYPQLCSRKFPNTSGLWLAHGDEPLLQQWLVDALRPYWQQSRLAIKRIDLVSHSTWQEVLGELNSLSLFDDATAVIVTGNHKPDKTVQDALIQLGQEQTLNTLLWLTSKLDKRSQSAKWITPFSRYGHIVDCQIYDERQRHQILSQKAIELGILLTDEAWQVLMIQTEHNLLGAFQTLWRLSDLYMTEADQPIHIDVAKLQQGLVSQSQYTAFDLSDAMLSGNAELVVKIVTHLKEADTPVTLVLWVLAKDMRLIQQLCDGNSPQSLGIWRSKENLYLKASRRHHLDSTTLWTDRLYKCDKAIKGVIRQPAWELILQMALLVAGIRLFNVA